MTTIDVINKTYVGSVVEINSSYDGYDDFAVIGKQGILTYTINEYNMAWIELKNYISGGVWALASEIDIVEPKYKSRSMPLPLPG